MSKTPQLSKQLVSFANEQRVSYRAMIPMAGIPDPVSDVRDIHITAFNPSRTLRARVYRPVAVSKTEILPVVLFIHGGGWVSGDLDTHEVMIRALTNKSKSVVVSLEYRLAPEAPLPAALEDVYSALQWISVRANEIGGDPGRISVCGDSAGGNLSAVVCLLARDRGGPHLQAQILFYASTAGSRETVPRLPEHEERFPSRESMNLVRRCYVPTEDETTHNPLFAPLLGQLHDLPPALIIVAEFDPLKMDGLVYAEKLREAGVRVELSEYLNVEHGFVQFYKSKANQPMGAQALAQAGKFLKAINSTK